MRTGSKQKKIDIQIPKLDDFIHKVYTNVARQVYKNVYIFENNIETRSFKNTFVVPTKNEKDKILKEITDFKASINNCKDCMTEEAKAILLSDFLEQNKLYLK